MRVRFNEISNPENFYGGDLTESVRGVGLSAVKVRDLRISFYEDTNGVFKSLLLNQVITLVIDGSQIDFYKKIGTSCADIFLSTH